MAEMMVVMMAFVLADWMVEMMKSYQPAGLI
jgi:hypothetical protein